LIDFTASIKSKNSIGNILLNDNISNYISEISRHHQLQVKTHNQPDKQLRNSYTIDGTLILSTLSDGKIVSIGCNTRYKGLYKNSLSTGMAFAQIKKLTARQRIFNGSLIIDEDFGFSYVLPSPYDEIADSIEDIPPDLKLNEIYISDFSSWISPRY